MYPKSGSGSQRTRKTELVESGIFSEPHHRQAHHWRAQSWRGRLLAIPRQEGRTQWTGRRMVPTPNPGGFCLAESPRSCQVHAGLKGGGMACWLCGIPVPGPCLVSLKDWTRRSCQPQAYTSLCLLPDLNPLCDGAHQWPQRLRLSQSSVSRSLGGWLPRSPQA